MRSRRRNGDERLRELTRRVAAGEHDLIPLLAREWERAGGRSEPALDEPLSIQQMRDKADATVAGTVSGVVGVNLGEVIAADNETFLDMLSERLTGDASLSNVQYKVVGLGKHEDDLLIEVTGDPSMILDDAAPATCSACGGVLSEDLDRHENGSWEDQCQSCRLGRRGRGRHVHTPSIESGPLCNCAHVQSLHHGGTGRCHGTGADIDPEYAIPPGEWCSCQAFDLSD